MILTYAAAIACGWIALGVAVAITVGRGTHIADVAARRHRATARARRHRHP